MNHDVNFNLGFGLTTIHRKLRDLKQKAYIKKESGKED